jgi:hypothetical protein
VLLAQQACNNSATTICQLELIADVGKLLKVLLKNTHNPYYQQTDQILPTPMAPPPTPHPWPGHLLNKKSPKHAGSKVLKVVYEGSKSSLFYFFPFESLSYHM